MLTPGNFGNCFDAIALESNVQIQHLWPAVATVVMTPWGAALSPLPPLTVSETMQHDNVAQKTPLQTQHKATNEGQNARNNDAEVALLQQKQLEKQQQMLMELILLQQKHQHECQKRGDERLSTA